MGQQMICQVRRRAAGPLTPGSENVDNELKTAVDEYLNAKPARKATGFDNYTTLTKGEGQIDPALYSNEVCGRKGYPEL